MTGGQTDPNPAPNLLFAQPIAIRNRKIVWKHGPDWPFYALMLRTKLY